MDIDLADKKNTAFREIVRTNVDFQGDEIKSVEWLSDMRRKRNDKIWLKDRSEEDCGGIRVVRQNYVWCSRALVIVQTT